jgi:predicted deacylase
VKSPAPSASTTRLLATLLLAMPLVASSQDTAQAPFTIGTTVVAPRSSQSGSLEVPARSGDQGTTIPFTVVNGVQSGPVLALVAGVHGQEYAPILALQRLRTAIDPATLTGTVLMVHVANVPSFLGRTIYYSPVDGKNLNRVFPGKSDGTLSERIAATLTREVIDRATHVVDLHCGDGNESLRPYVYWTVTGADQVVEAGRRMALATGFDHIIVDRERPADVSASIYLANTAIVRGKPGLTVESGYLASLDEESIGRLERAVSGLLRELGMRDTGPEPAHDVVWIDQSEVLRSSATGILVAEVERGHTVARGTLLARVTDFQGRTLEEIRSPFDGEVLYIVATPPITAGEPVAFIGQHRR